MKTTRQLAFLAGFEDYCHNRQAVTCPYRKPELEDAYWQGVLTAKELGS